MKPLLILLFTLNCFALSLTQDDNEELLLRSAEYNLTESLVAEYEFSKNKFKMSIFLDKETVEFLRNRYPDIQFKVVCYTFNDSRVIDSMEVVVTKDSSKVVHRTFIPTEIGQIMPVCDVTLLNTHKTYQK